MANLIYINNKLDLESFEQELGLEFNTLYKNYNTLSTKVWYEMHFPHNRTGSSTLWDLTLLSQYAMPQLDKSFNKDFETITNERALDIEQLHEQTGRPILINWSGGIDSTCAVAAIYKNFKPCNRKNVTILLNNFSYFENPVFFNKIIKPNFNFKQVELNQVDPWRDNIVISGEPADQIWLHADILEIIHRSPGGSTSSITKNADLLLEFLGSKSDPVHAKWFYDTVIESAAHSPVPITTFEDFYWWANFNFYLPGNSLKAYINDSSTHSQELFNLFQTYYKPWYLTNDYQQWSMLNNSNGVKINKTIQSYKLPSKKYIFEVDNNPYYYYYKTKTGSFKQYNSNEYKLSNIIKKVFAVYDNGSVVMIADPECRELLVNNQRLVK